MTVSPLNNLGLISGKSLVFLDKHLYDQSFRKKTTVITDQPSGKKTTTTTLQ